MPAAFQEERLVEMVREGYSFMKVLKNGLFHAKLAGFICAFIGGLFFIVTISNLFCALLGMLRLYNYNNEIILFPLMVAGTVGGVMLFLSREYRGYVIIKEFMKHLKTLHQQGTLSFPEDAPESQILLSALGKIDLEA